MRLEIFTWEEVEQYLVHSKGIILPIGSTEQHGPTGAIGTDAITAESVALEVGERTGVLVAPAQRFGMAEHHLGFPGTISLKPSTLFAVIHDILISLAMHGFEKIFIIIGHGGNIATIKSVFAEVYSSASKMDLKTAKALRCKLVNWFLTPEVFHEAKLLYGDQEGRHATPSEIALTLYVEPSLIDKQRPLPQPAPAGPIYDYKDFRKRYPDGRMGSNPFLAKASHGEIFLEKAADALSNELTAFIKE